MESIGLFVVMFTSILKTVIRVICVFSVLFIAFGVTFHLLLSTKVPEEFPEPVVSIARTVMMMMGDWDFGNIFHHPFRGRAQNYLLFPNVTLLFLIGFVVLMPILFINLLIGLAVGDIEMVRRDALLKKLAMQVQYHSTLERRLPNFFLRNFTFKSVTFHPNKCPKPQTLFKQLMLNIQDIGTVFYKPDTLYSCGGAPCDASGPAQINSKCMLDEFNTVRRKLRSVESALDNHKHLLHKIMTKLDIKIDEDSENAKDEGDHLDDDDDDAGHKRLRDNSGSRLKIRIPFAKLRNAPARHQEHEQNGGINMDVTTSAKNVDEVTVTPRRSQDIFKLKMRAVSAFKRNGTKHAIKHDV